MINYFNSGKLATASAVVADVVDCARHLGKTVTCLWDEEVITLKDYKDSSKKFFVRVKEEGDGKVTELFGDVEKIRILDGEFGFVTEVMSEREFAEKAEALPEMITRIRVEF